MDSIVANLYTQLDIRVTVTNFILINFTFKLEFARVIIDLGYDAERIIEGKVYNDFVKKASGTIVLAEVQNTR